MDTLLSLLNTSVTTAGVLAGVFFMMRYLNRGESPFASRETERFKAELTSLSKTVDGLMKQNLDLVAVVGAPISEEGRATLLQELTESLKNQAAQDVISRVQAAVEENSKKITALTLVARQSEQTIDRLRQELFSLTKRGNLNLSIGIVTTLTGLLLLGMFVLQEHQANADAASFLIDFVPRISLVVLIEIFAYFFLRLYKATLTEIKYFQNEVTSMEAKFLALTVATSSSSNEHLTKVVEHLSQTERNFILNKDQTTVDLERARMDHQERSDLWTKLSDVLKKKDS